VKKIAVLSFTSIFFVLLVHAQKLIPFQYQDKSKWNYKTLWGLMTADRKIVLSPTYYTIAPKVIEDNYMFLGTKIIEIKTGKTIWDSLECINVDKIIGNIVSIKMPLRGAYNYQPYSFKNIKTKKLIALEGKFANINGYVITEASGAEGVIDENGKVVIEQKMYQKISDYTTDCFVAVNDYDSYKNIYDAKGNKLNTTSYSEIELDYKKASLIVAHNLIDKEKNIYELIFITPLGKEAVQRLYYIKDVNERYFQKFDFTQNGCGVSRKKTVLYRSKECTEADKIMNPVLVNSDGKIIINNKTVIEIKEINQNMFVANMDDLKTTTFYNKNGNIVFTTNKYKNISVLNDNLFSATDTLDNKLYFLNGKSEKQVNGASFNTSNLIRENNGKGFLIFKKEYNKLFFNSFDIKSGISKFGEQFEMETGITINDITSTNGKYYLINIADNNKKQYATYIYDITGKLIQKSEDGLWMYSEGLFIKYTLNAKGDKMYIGYYDDDLKPYSIIKE
jgi:hypothetical protein